VLEAAATPGAIVEGAGAIVEGADAPASVCWHQDNLRSWWGTEPYRQHLQEIRDWCADRVGGSQTYRVSHIFPSSLLCSWRDPFGIRVSGGNGFTWTTVRSGAHYSCPSIIPWITFNYDRWQEWACNVWGNCSLVARS
jgi:hypothetical protein